MHSQLSRLARIPHFPSLAIATLMLGVAMSFTAPYLSLFGVEEASMSPVRLGIFMTLISASGVLASTVAGRWSDRRGRHRAPLILSLVAAALGFLSFCFLRDYGLLTASGVLLLGTGAASLSQVFSFGRAALPVADNAERDFASAALRTLLSVAWVFGPAVGALILAQAGFNGLFGFAAASFAVSAALVSLIVEAPSGRHGEAAAKAADADVGPASQATSRSNEHRHASRRVALPTSDEVPLGLLWRALFALTLIGLAASATMIVLPLYVVHALKGTRFTVSATLGLGAFLEIPMMLWLGARSLKLNKLGWLTTSAAVQAGYFVAVAAVRDPVAVIPLQALSAYVVSVTSCLGMTYVQDLMPRQPGAATALFFNAWRVGSILSGVLSGTIIGAFGYRSVFLMCLGIALVAFVLLAIDALPAMRSRATSVLLRLFRLRARRRAASRRSN
ncbi:sugar efflux transporter [Trinickia sp. EG282A]|uniref:sugar efflux transporter n=1 Tax=Trinickia sp. EG282A TaxID=3237013 RepID=UPI0034D1620F